MSLRKTITYRNLNTILEQQLLDARASMQKIAATLSQRVLSAGDLRLGSGINLAGVGSGTGNGVVINGELINKELIN